MNTKSIHIPQWIGGGLGNEFFPFAKAHLASQSVGGRIYYPLQLDFVRKHSYFAHLWFRSLVHRGTRGGKVFYYLPKEYLQDVQKTGTFDYGENVKRFLCRLPAGRKRIVHGGMVGGFPSIASARPFVRHYLYSKVIDPEFSHAQLLAPRNPRRINIGVHIRRGDFRPDEDANAKEGGRATSANVPSRSSAISFGTLYKYFLAYNQYDLARGGIQAQDTECHTKWNKQIPIGWFTHLIVSIAEAFHNQVEFTLVTDGLTEDEKSVLITALGSIPFYFGQVGNPQKDLLLLASCDALICSTSSFSMWGAFLSEAPAIFYRDHLNDAHTDSPYFWSKPNEKPLPLPQDNSWFAIGLRDVHLPAAFQNTLAEKLKRKQAWLKSPVMGGYFST